MVQFDRGKMKFRTELLASAVAVLLCSCASRPLPVAYEPPAAQDAAYLVSEDNLGPGRMFLIGGVSIYAAGVDGLPVSLARERGAEPLPIRPGMRRILIARMSGAGSGMIPVEFDARAGETYFIRHGVEKSDGLSGLFDLGRWFFWIEDKAGNRATNPVEMVIQRTQQTTVPIFIPKGK
jgi:hypothetical protein